MREIRRTSQVDKQQLKVDVQIVAIAIINGAEKIVTREWELFRRIAKGRIPVEEVPPLQDQREIPFPAPPAG